MAISIPLATKEQVRKMRELVEEESESLSADGLDDVQVKLAKIQAMKDQDLITSEEAEKLRSKALGI